MALKEKVSEELEVSQDSESGFRVTQNINVDSENQLDVDEKN